MSCNGDYQEADDSVVCLDTTQDSSVCENDADVTDHNDLDDKSSEGKTLPPGAAPEGFIVIDEAVDDLEEKNEEDEPVIKVIFRDKTVAR